MIPKKKLKIQSFVDIHKIQSHKQFLQRKLLCKGGQDCPASKGIFSKSDGPSSISGVHR